jgi:uroporphyrinogen-III decarboxylase
VVQNRWERLIAPAKDHGIPVLFRSRGAVEGILPILHKIGFRAVYPSGYGSDDLLKWKKQWENRLAFMGNVPVELLANGSDDEIDEAVKASCLKLAPGGGYVLASSGRIADGVPPENFVALVRAVHKYGRYESLGVEPGPPGVEWPCAGAGLNTRSETPEDGVGRSSAPAQPGTSGSA